MGPDEGTRAERRREVTIELHVSLVQNFTIESKLSGAGDGRPRIFLAMRSISDSNSNALA